MYRPLGSYPLFLAFGTSPPETVRGAAMPAITTQERDLVARETSTQTTVHLEWGPNAPWTARQHVRSQLPADLAPGRTCDLVLLTSELVTNAVEYSEAG